MNLKLTHTHKHKSKLTKNTRTISGVDHVKKRRKLQQREQRHGHASQPDDRNEDDGVPPGSHEEHSRAERDHERRDGEEEGNEADDQSVGQCIQKILDCVA